jgi:hypothetical protein
VSGETVPSQLQVTEDHGWEWVMSRYILRAVTSALVFGITLPAGALMFTGVVMLAAAPGQHRPILSIDRPPAPSNASSPDGKPVRIIASASQIPFVEAASKPVVVNLPGPDAEKPVSPVAAGLHAPMAEKPGLDVVPTPPPQIAPQVAPTQPVRAERCDQIWSYDIVEGETYEGRKFKVLAIIDEFTHESLAIRVVRTTEASELGAILSELFMARGLPSHIRPGSAGGRPAAKSIQAWIAEVGVTTIVLPHSAPGTNAMDDFTARLRGELIGAESFASLSEARFGLENWRRHYNLTFARIPSAPGTAAPAGFKPIPAAWPVAASWPAPRAAPFRWHRYAF